MSGIYPSAWQETIVKLLPKKRKCIKDLRPICILPCLSKILEKEIHVQVSNYIEANIFLAVYQSGFRKRIALQLLYRMLLVIFWKRKTSGRAQYWYCWTFQWLSIRLVESYFTQKWSIMALIYQLLRKAISNDSGTLWGWYIK